MRTTVGSAIGLMLALNVPATIGLIALATPIIALIFEHGKFTAADTAATALALRYYALGLVGYSIVRIISPAFYALHRSRIPVIASITSVVANILLNVMLIEVMGYAGLALGTSLAAIVNAGIQFLFLRHALGGLEGRRILVTFFKATDRLRGDGRGRLVRGAVAAHADAWVGDVDPDRPRRRRHRGRAGRPGAVGVHPAPARVRGIARDDHAEGWGSSDDETVRIEFDDLGNGLDALRHRLLRQHVRAAAADADPAARACR